MKCIALDLPGIRKTIISLFFYAHKSLIFTIYVYSFLNDIFKEEHLLFELLEDTLIWCPQHFVDLGNLVQLIGSRKERIQTETHRYTPI